MYFCSKFRRFPSGVSWLHLFWACDGREDLVGQRCSPHGGQGAERAREEDVGGKCTLPGHPPVTYFLPLGSTSQSLHPLPRTHEVMNP